MSRVILKNLRDFEEIWNHEEDEVVLVGNAKQTFAAALAKAWPGSTIQEDMNKRKFVVGRKPAGYQSGERVILTMGRVWDMEM